MSWLLNAVSKTYSLTGDIALLGAIAELKSYYDVQNVETNFWQINQALEKITNQNSDYQVIEEALASNDVDVQAAIAQWQKVKRYLEQLLPERFNSLTKSLVELAENEPPHRLNLPLLNTEGNITPATLGAYGLNINAETGVNINVEAIPNTLNFKGENDTALKQAIHMSLDAALAINNEVELTQLNLAALNNIDALVDQEIHPAIQIDWLFFNDQNQSFAQALANNLSHLASPFELYSLASSVLGLDREKALAQVTCSQEQVRRFSGKVKVDKVPVPGLSSSISLSGQVNYEASYAGEFAYVFYKENNKPTLEIRRSKSTQEDYLASINVHCDVFPLLTQFKDLLLADSADLLALINQLEDILPSDEPLKEIITEQIGASLNNEAQLQVIQSLLGLDKPIHEVLANIIFAEVNTSLARWQGVDEDVVDLITAEVVSYFPLNETLRDKLTPVIKRQIEDVLDSEASRLANQIDQLIQQTPLAELMSYLNKLGKHVDSIEGEVVNLLAPIKEVLAEYQKRVTDFREALEASTATQLVAQWQTSSMRQEHSSLELKLRFNDYQSNAVQALFQQILVGNLINVSDYILQPNSNPMIEIIEGELLRSIGYSQHAGIGVRLFGLNFENTSTHSGRVHFQQNSVGNIEIQSETQISAARIALKEQRVVNFVNVFDLATANQTRDFSISLNLSNKDNHIKPKEWQSFWQSLHGAKLITDATLAAQKSLFSEAEQHFSETEQQVAPKGIYGFSLNIIGDEVHELFGLDQHFKQVRPNAQTLGIIAQALVGIAQTRFVNRITEDDVHLLREHHRELNLPAFMTLADAIRIYDEPLYKRSSGLVPVHDGSGNELTAIILNTHILHIKAKHLLEALAVLRSVYMSGMQADESVWSVEDYLNAQEQLDKHLSDWLSVKGKFVLFIADDIREYTLALLRILLTLAGREVTGNQDQVSLQFSAM